MRPALTLSSPAISRSVVDLPHPDGPSSTSSLPTGASKLTSSTARVVPQSLLTCRTEMADTLDSEGGFAPWICDHFTPGPDGVCRAGACPPPLVLIVQPTWPTRGRASPG